MLWASIFIIALEMVFLELAEQNPNRICVIDGNKSQEEVFETIINNL
jgi:thymidylate kinase